MSENRRKIIIIDPKFQLKFSFVIVSLIFLSGLIYPISFYEALSGIANLKEIKLTLIKTLISIQAIFLILSFFICVFISHKIAGPIYRTKLLLKESIARKRYFFLNFRKDDYFHDFSQLFNSFMQSQQEQDQVNLLKLKKLKNIIQKDQEALSVLEEIEKNIENKIKT